ncbi:MAG TPA: alpha/beta hydrolase [bacterium]
MKNLPSYHPFRSAQAKRKYYSLYDLHAKKWPTVSRTKMIDTSWGPTFVRVGGPAGAPPIVLLPGVSNNSLMWIPNIKALSREFRTYAVDSIYDYGKSVYTRPIRGPKDYVNWLDQLFTGLRLKNGINLIGASYGAWQASQYALRFPKRLRKMVWLSPVGIVEPLGFGFIWRAILCALPLRSMTQQLCYWLSEDSVQKGGAAGELVEDMVDLGFTATRCFTTRKMIPPGILTDSELKGLRVPTLVVVGINEKIYSALKAVERVERVAPKIVTELVPGAGHDLFIVQADLVNNRVLKFLK